HVRGRRTSRPAPPPRASGAARARSASSRRVAGAYRPRDPRPRRKVMATPRTVAIDGPAGAGKSTIGALVAERMGYTFLDPGAMYRAVALAALRRGIDPNDAPGLAALARQIRIAIGPPTVRDGRAYTVLLDGADVTWALRGDDVDRIVSQVARIPQVRDAMVEQQREVAKRGRVVMVGRDIGAVVLPQAELKAVRTA